MALGGDIRFSVRRVINVLRPKPRFVPLTVDQILSHQGSRDLVERFNDLYYSSGVAEGLQWRGAPLLKNPCDLWTYVDLISDLRPTAIVETGTHHGASATFFADIAALLGVTCTVITIDIGPKWSFRPASHNIISLVGRSTDPAIVERAHREVEAAQRRRSGHVIVTLDSDHTERNVAEELRLYSGVVTRDSYLVVEDTNVNGHPSAPNHGPGPWEAVHAFVERSSDFVVDRTRERHLLTFNPGGWLRRR